MSNKRWLVYWDNAWHPNGKGRKFSRYGDAIKFAKKQDAKSTTRWVDISCEGYFTWVNSKTKEEFMFADTSYRLDEIPNWLHH